MTAHRPKTAALLALADDLLSEPGQARIARHLAKCEICQRELATIRAYERVASETRDELAPELDFARMEATLAREAERVSATIRRKQRRPHYAVWGVLAAAAIALAVVYAAWPNTPVRPVARRTEPAPVQNEPVFLEPVVTLAAGEAVKVGAGPLEPGHVLREGDRLRTGADGVLHVRLAEGTGFVVDAASEVELSRTREERVELALAVGTLSHAVAPLRNGSSYVILSAGHTIEVRGTRFVVSFVDTVLGVDVAEGTVLVTTPTGAQIELVAPAHWRSDGGAGSAREPVAPRLGRIEGDSVLTLSHPALVRWAVDGTAVDSAGAVRLRMRDGEHRVQGWDERGRLFIALARVEGNPVFISEGELQPEEPRLRPGHLDDADIQRVMANGRGQIARCYERSLRLHPEDQPPAMRLRIFVGLMGEVRRVQLQGGDAARPELRECIVRYAESWTFPPPGGSVPPLELPLTFTTRRSFPTQ